MEREGEGNVLDLDLDDLGIIEVGDEEWSEYDVEDAAPNENKKNRVVSLKQKGNTISPQLSSRDKSPYTRISNESHPNRSNKPDTRSHVKLSMNQ